MNVCVFHIATKTLEQVEISLDVAVVCSQSRLRKSWYYSPRLWGPL